MYHPPASPRSDYADQILLPQRRPPCEIDRSLPTLFHPYISETCGELIIVNEHELLETVLQAVLPEWPSKVVIQQLSHRPHIDPANPDIACVRSTGVLGPKVLVDVNSQVEDFRAQCPADDEGARAGEAPAGGGDAEQ